MADPMHGAAHDDASPPRRPWWRWWGWWRRHRALSILVAGALLLAVPTAGWVVYLNHQLSDVPHFDVDLDRPGRPAATPGAALDILLAGVDDPDREHGPSLHEALGARTWPKGEFRSDAIMVLHLDAAREHAQLVSIPRDSYVAVEGYGTTKLNAAFSYGGPSLLARTVEDVTGLRLDHVLVVDFDGLARMTDILGGVELTLPSPQPNPVDGTTWSAGRHRMNGEQALAYVRERKSLPGGDFDRVQRQQNYLRSLLAELADAGTLRNPVTLTRLLSSLEDTVAVDSGLTPGRMRGLVWSARGLRPGDVRYATAPHRGTPTIDGASVVLLDTEAVEDMFRALRDDALPAWLDQHRDTADQLPAPDRVR